MKRLGRVGLSFACSMIAALIVSATLCLIQYGSKAQLGGMVVGVVAECFLVIPGWLLALPLVIFIDRIDGWRFWTIAAIGFFIGPAIMLSIAFCAKASDGTATYGRESVQLLYAAIGISLLTTTLYLTGLKAGFRELVEPKPADC